MKTINILIIAIIVLLISGAVSTGLFFLSEPQKTIQKIDFNQYDTFDPKNIELIDIESVSGEIIVTNSLTNQITLNQIGKCEIIQYGEESISAIPEVTHKDGIITSRIPSNTFNWKTHIKHCDHSIELGLPKTYVKSLALETVNADILIDTNKLASLDIETVSGETNINSEITQGYIETVSGDVSISKVSFLSYEGVSGNINVYSLLKGEISTISGNTEIHLKEGQFIDFDSVSGNIQGKSLQDEQADIEVESVSGNLIIS